MISAFTSDWVSPHASIWLRHLKPWAGKSGLRCLEIGSFEGRSAVWLVQNILYGQDSTLDCVDCWYPTGSDVEKRFDLNTKPFRHKINKHRSRSFDWLVRRNEAVRELYDIVYIDGDHHAQAVLSDLTLCWPLLKPGGILICDDYLWAQCEENQRPALAIDAFLNMRNDWSELHNGYQRIVQKHAIAQLPSQHHDAHTAGNVLDRVAPDELVDENRGIEALVTCVDYADYLAQTLPCLLEQVDRVVVVTTPDDDATAEVVAKHDRVELVQTDAFYRNGDLFNKGAAINEGLQRLSVNTWTLLIDADTAILGGIPIPADRQAIYGARRLRVCGPVQWEHVKRLHALHLEELHSNMGPAGYFPYGFFQLYYRDEQTLGYPENLTDASESDYAFAMRWSRRVQLDMRVAHLEMPDARPGINWQGRKSLQFSQETLAESGVLTASNSNYWPTLRLMAQACAKAGVELCVVDHGLKDQHLDWLSAHGVHVRKDLRGSLCGPAIHGHSIPQQAWLKPKICMESPFERTVWIDADAIPLRRLRELVERIDRGPWIAREAYLSEAELRKSYLMCVNLLLGKLPSRYAEASQVSTGVFGFKRDDLWLQRWDEICRAIQAESSLATHAWLLDQSAMVCLLCEDRSDVPRPEIVNDQSYNWSANHCNSGQAKDRVNYAWEASDCLDSIRSDHPEAAVVHWMGHKPWRMENEPMSL